MIYRSFKEIKLSALGFGTMRLPLVEGSKTIDQEAVQTMTDLAMAAGVNYYDTAWPYHDGNSETSIAKALAKYPRDSYYIADKYPGHQLAETYDPADIFEKQLVKLGTDHIDFYLLHNVYEKSYEVYNDPQWGIVDYFIEQRRLGRIRHLGFSCHAEIPTLAAFLDRYGDEMEFCQIQLNYLDWTLQNAKAKYELLTSRGIPVWVMEPLRGGLLARQQDATVAQAFRWLQSLPNVTVVLSGMSSVAQMEDNLKTFESESPISDADVNSLMAVAEKLKDSIPCTACRYCCSQCPMGLDIPRLIASYNDLRVMTSLAPLMMVESLPEDKRPSACLGCGACAQMCPQKIDIPSAMADFASRLAKLPSWEQTCRERAAAQKKA